MSKNPEQMQPGDRSELIRFVVEALEHEAVSPMRRIRIMRGLAFVCGDEKEQKRLLDAVRFLTAGEEFYRDFNFDFMRKNQDF